jgi:hypothetical protein
MAEEEGSTPTTTTTLLPDLLKNTPSNIARLEDVIEHSKARHKYLAQTTSPSDGGDVRWYFCKTPLAPNGIFLSIIITFFHCYHYSFLQCNIGFLHLSLIKMHHKLILHRHPPILVQLIKISKLLGRTS